MYAETPYTAPTARNASVAAAVVRTEVMRTIAVETEGATVVGNVDTAWAFAVRVLSVPAKLDPKVAGKAPHGYPLRQTDVETSQTEPDAPGKTYAVIASVVYVPDTETRMLAAYVSVVETKDAYAAVEAQDDGRATSMADDTYAVDRSTGEQPQAGVEVRGDAVVVGTDPVLTRRVGRYVVPSYHSS
ncbi:hypothetical protein FIBSPDRAFT_969379 [Athelia psychrophila]|uniref:Uncharacterized protein n=1 Tax=Athelia psychrophila TaxID=1759441 RepID=A0A167TKG9_9AGAM|nr:hypothetical protein FIBSPDRAFT_969379 [Fibularhizoctonia sp. CBS 109695]